MTSPNVELVLVAEALVVLAAYVILGGAIWGSPFQPVPRRSLTRMLELAEVGPGLRVYDLGSGLGRIVIEAAQAYHANCVGVEVDPLKAWWSRRAVIRKGLGDLVQIRRGNLFDVDVSDADVVFVYLFPPIMRRLRDKLLGEMKEGKMVVSQAHRFPDWEPETADKNLGVYVYRIPSKNSAVRGSALPA